MSNPFFACSKGDIDVEMMEDDDDGATMWTSAPFSPLNPLHKGLMDMEELLRCNCCKELMQVPVSIIQCKHTMCNHCFSQYAKTSMRSMKRKVCCPMCRHEISGDVDKSLVPNSTMEELIRHYKAIRPLLKQAVFIANNNNVETATTTTLASSSSEGTPEVTTKINAQSHDTSNSNAGKRKRSVATYAETEDNDEDDINNNDTENHCHHNHLDNDNGKDVVEVLHQRDDNQTKRFATCGAITRKKKTKVSYNHTNKKKLMELCKQENLPAHGSEAELRARHDAFITLYNAECDSIRPRDHMELVREVVNAEAARKKAAAMHSKDSKCMEKLKRNREELGTSNNESSSGSVARSGNTDFDQKMSTNFAAMIADVKARKERERNKAASSRPLNDNIGDSKAVNSASEINGEGSPALNQENGSSPIQENNSGMDGPSAETSNDMGEPSQANSTSAAPGSSFTPVVRIQNPYKKNRSTGSSRLTLLEPGSAAPFLSPNANTSNTPQGAPRLFQSGSIAPSTISHKQSQSFLVSSTQDAPDALLGVATSREGSQYVRRG